MCSYILKVLKKMLRMDGGDCQVHLRRASSTRPACRQMSAKVNRKKILAHGWWRCWYSLTLEGYLQAGAMNYWAQILWELENCVACDWVSDPGCTPGGAAVAEKQAHKGPQWSELWRHWCGRGMLWSYRDGLASIVLTNKNTDALF